MRGGRPPSCDAISSAAAGILTRMTSITAQTHATLDGVIDAPPADARLPYVSDAGRQGALDLALAADALLLARETWQGLAGAWRDQTGPMAERLNAMPNERALGRAWLDTGSRPAGELGRTTAGPRALCAL